jgi:hypothetical protein
MHLLHARNPQREDSLVLGERLADLNFSAPISQQSSLSRAPLMPSTSQTAALPRQRLLIPARRGLPRLTSGSLPR